MKTTFILPALAIVVPALTRTLHPSILPQSFAVALVASSFSQLSTAYVIHPDGASFQISHRRSLQTRQRGGRAGGAGGNGGSRGTGGRGERGGRGGRGRNRNGGGNGGNGTGGNNAATNATTVDNGASAANATSAASNATIADTGVVTNATVVDSSTVDNSTTATGNETAIADAGASAANETATAGIPTPDGTSAESPTATDITPIDLSTVVGTGPTPEAVPEKFKIKRTGGKPLYTRNLDQRMRRWAEPEVQWGVN